MKVFHSNKLWIPFLDENPQFPNEYKFVADVVCETLDEAYALTQNITSPWVMNREVSSPMLQCRSTSAGDVIVDNDNEFWIVDYMGFKKLELNIETALHVAIAIGAGKPNLSDVSKEVLLKTVKIHDEMEEASAANAAKVIASLDEETKTEIKNALK